VARRRRLKRWIQRIHLKKGALHRQLGIPVGEKIPLSLLHATAKEPGKLGHRARLALTLRTFRHKKRK
jgi:hypothetical protein